MRFGSLRVGLVAVLIVALPVVAADPKKPGDKPGKNKSGNGQAATPTEIRQVLQMGELQGKIAKIDSATKLMTVQIEYQQVEANNPKGPGGQGNNQAGQKAAQEAARAQQELLRNQKEMMRLQQEILREQQKIMQIQDPGKQQQEMQRFLARIQQQLHRQQPGQRPPRPGAGNPGQFVAQNPVRVVTMRKDFEVRAIEDVKVRMPSPPPAFDEKGNPKKYTDKELKELKGPNANLPGYTGQFGQVKIGSTVKVQFARKKAEAKDKEEEKEFGLQPAVSMIVVLVDEGTPQQEKAIKGKKNK